MNTRVRVRDPTEPARSRIHPCLPSGRRTGPQAFVPFPHGDGHPRARLLETVEFSAPAGTRRLKVEEIVYQPEDRGTTTCRAKQFVGSEPATKQREVFVQDASRWATLLDISEQIAAIGKGPECAGQHAEDRGEFRRTGRSTANTSITEPASMAKDGLGPPSVVAELHPWHLQGVHAETYTDVRCRSRS